MKKTIKMSILGMFTVTTLVAPVALAVSCGESNESGVIKVQPFQIREKANGSNTTMIPGDYKAQLIIDGNEHSVDDNSFNQAAYDAVKALSNPINGAGITISKGNPDNSKPDAPSGIEQFASAYTAAPENSVLVVAGFVQVDPLIYFKNQLEAQKKYAILLDGDVIDPRVASVNFQAHQAAFEAGVLAGYYLNANKDRFGEELKVATFGGLNIPSVTGSMAGFQKGIEYFNAHNDGMTDIIFMDNGSKADYFSGGFAPGGAKPIADKLVDADADLIFPVSGPQVNDVKESIITKKSSAQIIGVDTAQEEDATFMVNGESVIAFSALKDLTKAATGIMNVIAGIPVEGIKGLGEQTIGDLENGLVGVSRPSNVESIYDEAITPEVKDAAIAMKLEFNY